MQMNAFSVYMKKPSWSVAIIIVTLLAGCLRTEGNLKIEGGITDDFSGKPIPNRHVIIQALVDSIDRMAEVDAGQLTTDSTGRFTYILNKVKDAYFYNFYFVGDSDYAFSTRKLGLGEMHENAQFLSFQMSRLVELTVKISRRTRQPATDTLYLSMVSDRMRCNILYPYKVENFGKTNNYNVQDMQPMLRWTGGDINVIVRSRAYAGRRAELLWVLDRNGKRKRTTDTLTCRRDSPNIVSFTY